MTQPSIGELLKLIQDRSLRPASAGARSPLIASESDKGRIVNSAAFRRLQQKAQVFPLDPNAAVRTRLTHSIEVSQLGRYLAQKVIGKLGANDAKYAELAAFVNVVENACLLHDIGNPPFGHLGEAALREWFTGCAYGGEDLRSFDGNPQGFRLITLLSGRDDRGLNLTNSLLLSTVKYPWTRALKPKLEKKIGIFDMEWPIYEEACAAFGWRPGSRFPFVLLMEAADDIAYSMSDLEDGLEKKIIKIRDLEEVFGKERFESKSVYPIVQFKTGVINQAVEAAAETFASNLEPILSGEAVRLLARNSEIGTLLGKVKQFARAEIYSHPSAERVELAGRSVIGGLLNHFKALLDLEEEEFSDLLAGRKPESKDGEAPKERDFHVRLLRLLPAAYKERYAIARKGEERDRRAHLIVDFIAGMTDDYALQTYQVLQGIRIQ
jgi:dGTPase